MPRVAHVILALALLMSAFRPARAQDAAQDSPIIIGVTDFPHTLDPAEAYDFASWEVLSHLYTGLTRQIPGTYDYELALAADVRISDDRLTYTFTLRADAAFADGTPITAHTFVESIERVLALGRPAAQAITPYVASAAAAETGELVFTLTRPVPYFLALVSLPPYFPQHPDGIGNGPYGLAAVTAGQEIVLHANPAYQPAPQTPVIILRRYARSQDLRDALLAHEIDIAWRALYTGHLAELDRNGLRIITAPGTRVFYLYFNQTREPFDDPGVREAITRLVTRGDLADASGALAPLTSLIPPEFPGAYAPIWPDTFALEEAERALHAAGYRTRGQLQLQFRVGYSLPTYGLEYLDPFTRLVQRQFDESDYISAGLLTRIKTPALISQLERGEAADALIAAWTPLVPHPDAYLRPLAHGDEPIARNGGYASPQITRLLDDAGRLDDGSLLYREVAALLLADYALIPLFQETLHLAAWDTIGGIQIEGNRLLRYDLLSNGKRNSP